MLHSSVQLIPRIWAVLSLSCVLFIAGYHCLNVYKQWNNNKIHISKLSVVLTFLLFFFGTTRLIGFILQEFVQSSLICSVCANGGAATYIAFKSTLYLVLIHRLHHVYQNAPRVGYTAQRLSIWAAINLLFGLCNIVLVVVFRFAKHDHTQYPYCITGVTHKFVMVMVGLQDLVTGGVNIGLFVRPLFQLQRGGNTESGKAKKLTENLRKLAVKASVLSVVAIASTIFALAAVAVTEFYLTAVFIGSDIVVSILSVMLMYTWNNAIYEALCCCVAVHKKQDESNDAAMATNEGVNVHGIDVNVHQLPPPSKLAVRAASQSGCSSNSAPKHLELSPASPPSLDMDGAVTPAEDTSTGGVIATLND